LLSAVCFTGASQFALAGVVASGGSPVAAVSAALLLGLRNAFYGVPVTHIIRPTGLRRLLTAHFVIDETTAMAVAQQTPRGRRYAFWATGVTLFALWNAGTVIGALIGGDINTSALGLDAAAPAIFLALVWPQLTRHRARPVALGAVVVALALVTLVPAGVPIVAAAGVAVAAGLLPDRTRRVKGRR
jgi:4-azaleucine resistance transporter AzlC